MFFNFLPNALQSLLASLILTESQSSIPTSIFTVRHQYGLTNVSTAAFADFPSESGLLWPSYELKTRKLKRYKPTSQEEFFKSRISRSSQSLRWDEDEIAGPDVNDRETLLLLAQMTSNAYYQPGEKGWYDLGPHWNTSFPFGWEPDADGFRGHIFANEDNSTVVVSIKGTSAWLVGDGGPTTTKDQLNDNLLFSCCCAKVSRTWTTVCDCWQGGWKCDQSCLEQSLVEDSLFYPVGTNLYNNVTYMYPNAEIWLIGHSLGGSLASLLGATFGVPAVAFEAPGERMAARRLHLPSPPSTHHITHVFHTADPIPMGTCTGYGSICNTGGFALESRCHLGQVIKYDTVTKRGWYVSAGKHSIVYVIDNVLSTDWEESSEDGKPGRAVPEPIEEEDCEDCFKWEYGDYRNVSSLSCGH